MWLLGSLKALQKFGIFANTKKNICKFLHWYAEMHLTPKREKNCTFRYTPCENFIINRTRLGPLVFMLEPDSFHGGWSIKKCLVSQRVSVIYRFPSFIDIFQFGHWKIIVVSLVLMLLIDFSGWNG